MCDCTRVRCVHTRWAMRMCVSSVVSCESVCAQAAGMGHGQKNSAERLSPLGVRGSGSDHRSNQFTITN